ncbi:MAG: transcription-repair coupling factor [Acidimicrobiia bacterium]|nr:transcription-repair coupling factor [Acidimicrobiia bacterium]
MVAGLTRRTDRRPVVLAVPTTAEAERLADDLAVYLGPDAVEFFPAWETLPFERVSPGVETMGRRLRTMWRLSDPERHGPRGATAPAVVVASVRALVQRLGPHVAEAAPVVVGHGDRVDPTDLVERLVAMGYRREYQVEHRGEVAVRGSIVDVFGSTADAPVRIDLWGDEVDRLCTFAVGDQRALLDVAEVELFGCRELLVTDEVRQRAAALVLEAPWGAEHWERLADGVVFDGMESWLPWLTTDEQVLFDLVGSDALVLLVEPSRLVDRANDIGAEEADLATTLARTWDVAEGTTLPSLHLPFDRLLNHTDAPVWSIVGTPDRDSTPAVEVAGWRPVHDEGRPLIEQLRTLTGAGTTGGAGDGTRGGAAGGGALVVVAADGAGSAARLGGVLDDAGLEVRQPADAVRRGGLTVEVASVHRGVVLPEVGVGVLAEADLTGRRRTHRRHRVRRAAQAVFDDLRPGDTVVHDQHGVARFGGVVQRAIGGVERDYLLLEYRGDDKLYVPADQTESIRPYAGGDSPKLSRLGGSEWQRTRAKVRAEVAEVAQELVVLYQKRQHAEGVAFPTDTPWQLEMEDAFGYEPTPDQAKAIAEVKADMEAPHPMDRLVCGDVGFGKTEVALRAVFKAIQSGRQAAVLVPTTLLAQQHFTTFSDRLSPYPVRVEVLSRFLTPGQARAVAAGLADGTVDVVIGTHRLLAEDVTFANLGLLVVDEEQRFGVGHKERIKALRTGVDVLTLTATPIPRTLEMSLTGIRDLSLLQTAPAERQPILTHVGAYDERAVAEAIRRELLREGQVFFVHNRVRDIDRVAAELAELVPEARIAVAHGQMDEAALEQVVIDFWEQAYDVLVCTTIIESGIDMPTVNTLVVDRADLLGLGQLHQLRGRVGRAGQRAYAYLFFPPEVSLSEEAHERLRTIGEATELGSGFRIAMRDLEIRGAGNLLGTGQSGHIAAVGYDLYCQMVSEAVAELSGEQPATPTEVTVDIPLDAHLPASYIGRDDLRLDAYRRRAAATTPAAGDDGAAEWVDRFGPLPDPALALVDVAALRARCAAFGITEVTVAKGRGFGEPRYTATLSPVRLAASREMRLARRYRKAVYRKAAKVLVLEVSSARTAPEELTAAFEDLLEPEGTPS